MQASVVTLFPDLIRAFLETSVIGRATRAGLVRVDLVDLRMFGEGPHRVVDDRPFGGGPGMVLMAEPVLRAVEAARAGHGARVRTLLLTPQGTPFCQSMAASLAAAPDGFLLISGRYEGIDERVRTLLEPEEISLGDYVLSGGEIAAMAILDAAARLVPGVLGHERSSAEDSFTREGGHLDHPHYTRPAIVRGLQVPEILLSGHHGAVARWRAEQALRRTRSRRPDLLSAEEHARARDEEDAECSPES